MLKSLFSVETLIRFLAVTLGTLLSPTWPLLHFIIDPFLDLNALLAQGITLQTFPMLQAQVNAISAVTIITYIIPALLGCLALNIAFIFLCGRVGLMAKRYVVRRYQPAA